MGSYSHIYGVRGADKLDWTLFKSWLAEVIDDAVENPAQFKYAIDREFYFKDVDKFRGIVQKSESFRQFIANMRDTLVEFDGVVILRERYAATDSVDDPPAELLESAFKYYPEGGISLVELTSVKY